VFLSYEKILADDNNQIYKLAEYLNIDKNDINFKQFKRETRNYKSSLTILEKEILEQFFLIHIE